MPRYIRRIPRPDIPCFPPFGIGHNGGPPLSTGWQVTCWKKAKEKAFAAPREVVLMRLRRARELGMTYQQYTAILLDKGRVP